MSNLYKVLFSIGGCFVTVGFAICKLIGDLFSLVGLGFNAIGYYCNIGASKLKELADKLFEKNLDAMEHEDAEEFSWIPES